MTNAIGTVIAAVVSTDVRAVGLESPFSAPSESHDGISPMGLVQQRG